MAKELGNSVVGQQLDVGTIVDASDGVIEELRVGERLGIMVGLQLGADDGAEDGVMEGL